MTTTRFGSFVLMVMLGGSLALAVGADRILIRRTTLDKNDSEKPATLQFTWPKDGEHSYAVDIGMAVNCLARSKWDHWFLGPSAEWHRNSLLKDQQDTRIFGASAIGLFGDIERDHGVAHILEMSLNYKDDQIARVEGVQAVADYVPIATGLLIGRSAGPSWLWFTWQPTVGVEYEDRINTEAGAPEGHVGRGTAAVEITLNPAKDALKARLELSVGYRVWRDVAESLPDPDDGHGQLAASLSYWFDDGKHFGAAIDYVKGENPRDGLKKQEYTSMSLKFKFGGGPTSS